MDSLVSDYDSEESVSSYLSDTDVETILGNNSEENTMNEKNSNVLRNLNEELNESIQLIKNTNIPNLIENLRFLENKIPEINNLLEEKFINKNRKICNNYIKKELELQKDIFEIKNKEKNVKNILDNYKLKNNDMDEVIELNIGGKYYSTKKSTLCWYKLSYFYHLFSTEGNIIYDKNNKIFIDRDGYTFKYILNWLRNENYKSFPKPDNENYSLLIEDTKFYGLKKLERIVSFDPKKFKGNRFLIVKNFNKNIICLNTYEVNNNNNTYKVCYWGKKDMKYKECYSDEIVIEGVPDYISDIVKIAYKIFSLRRNTGSFYYYDNEQIKEIENIQCPICFDNIKENELINETPCGHIYHNKCLSNWLKNKNSCPKCRAKVKINKQVNHQI